MNEFCKTGGDVNVGRIACDAKMGTPVGLIFGYGVTTIKEEDGQDLSNLLSKTQSDNVRSRLYPYTMAFQSVADESTDPTIDTQASTGYTEKLADGSVQWAIGFPNTVCLGKQLVKLEKAGFTHVFVIANGYVWGIPSADGKSLTGFPIASYYVVGATINTDQVKSPTLHLNLGPIDTFVSDRSAIALDYSPSLIVGLTSYSLTAVGTPTATEVGVQLLDPCTGNPVTDLPEELAAAGAFTAVDASTGNPVTVGGVTFNEAAGSYTLTLSGVTAPATLSVRLANPSDLEALGVTGVTSSALTVQIGGGNA